MTILSWFELLEDERPPQRIWLDDEAIAAHFEQLDQKRRGGLDTELVPDVDLTENELTAAFKR